MHRRPAGFDRLRRCASALRASLAALCLAAALGGCLPAENPPSAAQPCDPALVGDWGLVEGDGFERAPITDPALFGRDGEQRLRIDAHCRAYLPSKQYLRQVDLAVFKADGQRYLGLRLVDWRTLMLGPKQARDSDTEQAQARFPHLVVLMRYRADAGSLTVDAGDGDALKRWVAQRNQQQASDPEQYADFLNGDARSIRKQLRAHPELFPGGKTLYRFERIPAAAR